MITMTFKLNKKKIDACEYKGYNSWKKMIESMLIGNGFTPQGKGIYTSKKESTNVLKEIIVPIIIEFIWTSEDLMDDIARWNYKDEKEEPFDVLDWYYNSTGRIFFEQVVIPDVQAFKKARAIQLKAKMKMLLMKNKPHNLDKEPMEELTLDTDPTEGEFPNENPVSSDDEVPF